LSKALAKATCPRSAGPVWVKFNVLSAVQEYVKNPTVNFGFLVINTSGAQEIDFVSSENKKSDQRPKLTVTYTAPSPAENRASGNVLRNELIVRRGARGIRMDASGMRSAAYVTALRPDGKLLFGSRIEPGAERYMTGLSPGLCIVTVKDGRGQRQSIVPVMP
jgi:hypothetical protein